MDWITSDSPEKLATITGEKVSEPKINKDGYVVWAISNTVVLRFLKQAGRRLKLPVLKRKWDRINENYVSRMEVSIQRIKKVRSLFEEGFNISQIASILNIEYATVYMIFKRNINVR